MVYLFIPPLSFKRLAVVFDKTSSLSERENLPNPSPLGTLVPLILAQSFFLLLSWVFFYTMEYQTRINVRLQPLEPGTIIGLMRDNPWTLCFCPWLCFAVCGVGLAYLSICFQRTPTIPAALFPEHQKHPQLFFHNYCQIVVNTVLLGPPIYLLALTVIWCAEALNISFGWPSLFLYPWKTTVGFILIVLVFRNSHQKLLDYLFERKTPLGGILTLYAMGIAVFLFWIHSFGSWFTFGIESTDPNTVLKSPLAGSFTEQELTNRLQLLIWGWWAIWVPHFASLIARLSMGRRIFEACIYSILFPVVFFLILLPKQDKAFLQTFFPNQLPISMHWLIAFFLIFILMIIFGQTRNTGDINRIAMPKNIGKPIKGRSLKQWFMPMMSIFICYMTGEYLLGWVPSQIVVTLGAIFMMSVVFIFLWVLFSTRDHSVAEAKCKVPSES